MKKKIMILTVTIFVLCAAFAMGVYAASKLTLIVNGQVSTKADMKVISGTTYVPLRSVAELLGANVDYDNATKTIKISGKASQTVDSYKVDEFVFTQLQANEKTYGGYDVSVEISNNSGIDYKFVTYTAVFYDGNGKRLGAAKGVNYDLGKGQQKYDSLILTGDITGYEKVKFQIDSKY